jgi:hypothetical protein
MGAGLGFKTFVTGDVLTATDTNGYLMQGVWVFANAAARSAAVTSPQEGNMSFLKDTNSTEYYSGSAWVAVAGAVSSGMTLITTASPSASSTVDIDNCFSSTYQSYQVHYNISGTAAAEVKMRLRVGGVTATTGYTTQFLAASSTTVSAGRDTTVQAFVSPAIRSTGRTYAISFISNPFAAAETSYFTLGQDPASNATLENRCGNNTNATSYDGLSFFTSSGNFTGSIRIYGVQN